MFAKGTPIGVRFGKNVVYTLKFLDSKHRLLNIIH